MRLASPPCSCKIYTPANLANAMTQALGDTPKATWLEPCHGTGVFVEAISRLGVPKDRIVALDLDRKKSTADRLARTLRGVDFLRWAYETQQRFDRIVGNPPFISIERLPKSLQKAAALVVDFNERPIGRGSNVWYAFVLASLRLLKKGGCLAFVLPSSAQFADYSVSIRHAIRETFSSLELYRSKYPLFEDVQEGTLIAVARGYGSSPCMVRRKHFETSQGLIRALLKSGSRNGHKCPPARTSSVFSIITLDLVAEIRLGGVTGDASYFLMNDDKRKSLELPPESLTPVVSKARHLRHAQLTSSEWEKLKVSGERIWLFNPSKLFAKQPAVKRYLELATEKGGCNTDAYKVKIRDPWYRTPLPKAPHAFISGMHQYGPWLCINEMEGLNATNTLYVVTFRSQSRDVWYRWALALLTSIAQRQVRRIGRIYAEGLVKYEPGPLGKIRLPKLRLDVDHRQLYIEAIDALLKGDLRKAKNIADSALLPSCKR